MTRQSVQTVDRRLKLAELILQQIARVVLVIGVWELLKRVWSGL